MLQALWQPIRQELVFTFVYQWKTIHITPGLSLLEMPLMRDFLDVEILLSLIIGLDLLAVIQANYLQIFYIMKESKSGHCNATHQ